MAQYKTGSVTVVNGSPTVQGTDTRFLSNVKPGDLFSVGVGASVVLYTVAAIATDTELSLTTQYSGASETTAVGGYAITRNFTPNFNLPTWDPADVYTARINARQMEKIDQLLSWALSIGATGPLADRVNFDSEAEGFIYLATDLEPPEAYIRVSATPGVWSAGFTLFGDGNKGWSPVFAVANRGSDEVLQIADWTGGEGDKPLGIGEYVSPLGLTSNIGEAVNVRGSIGLQGASGPQGQKGEKGDKGDPGLDATVTFIADLDTPSSYAGNAGNIPAVSDLEDGLIFTNPTGLRTEGFVYSNTLQGSGTVLEYEAGNSALAVSGTLTGWDGQGQLYYARVLLGYNGTAVNLNTTETFPAPGGWNVTANATAGLVTLDVIGPAQWHFKYNLGIILEDSPDIGLVGSGIIAGGF